MTQETAAKKDTQKLQRAIVDGLEDVKGHDIAVFNTEHLSPLFERVIVASGTSNRQTKALAASVRDAVREAGFPKPRIEGEENGEWIIVDCGAAVAHIMQPAIRQYYHLEEIWGEKPVRVKMAGAPRPAMAQGDGEDRAPAAGKRSAHASTAKGAGKTATGKSTAGKSAAGKSASAKSAAGKSAPPKSSGARSTGVKTTGAKSTGARSAGNSVASRSTAAKSAAGKTAGRTRTAPVKTATKSVTRAGAKAAAPIKATAKKSAAKTVTVRMGGARTGAAKSTAKKAASPRKPRG